MIIHLIAVGTRITTWANDGFNEYQQRLPPECKINLIPIPLSKRTKTSCISQHIEQEQKKILAAIPKGSRVIALDVTGQPWSTQQFAEVLRRWQLERQDISLLVGGPDGLGAACLSKAEQIWSLSPLTLPHALVRVLLAEQIYRAWSLLQGHPYHRA